MITKRASEVQSDVIRMYERHPFPSIEDKAQKAEDEMPMRLKMLAIQPEAYVGKRVLDAGCGTGEYSTWYARRGAHITAVDLSGPSLGIASEYAKKQGLDNVDFQQQSVLDLPFEDASFDYVYSMGVLHHTPDPYRGFVQLCRVLKPGGVLMVSLYNKYGRLVHNRRQRRVNRIAGEDIDMRVEVAKRLFPRTCRSLKRNRHDESDIILYDAFGIPHESQHTAGELLGWFDRNSIDFMGAFGPLTVRDNLKALAIMDRDKGNDGFKRFFDGYPLAEKAVNVLPRLAGGLSPRVDEDAMTFKRPSWISRGVVQACWFGLGFRFSIFAISGRKRAD